MAASKCCLVTVEGHFKTEMHKDTYEASQRGDTFTLQRIGEKVITLKSEVYFKVFKILYSSFQINEGGGGVKKQGVGKQIKEGGRNKRGLHFQNKKLSNILYKLNNRIIFAQRIYLYSTIRRNVTVEGISPYAPTIASILFSNYYILFTMFIICNV